MRSAVLLVLLALSSPKPTPPDVVARYSLSGDIVGGEAAAVAEIARWARRAGAQELDLLVDSRGGNADEALALYEAVRGAGLRTVCRVPAGGTAASGAFLVLQACDVRLVAADARLMMHEPAVIVPERAVVTVNGAAYMAAHLRLLADAMDAIVAKRLGLPLKAYRERVEDGAAWRMTGAEAVRAHAADRLL